MKTVGRRVAVWVFLIVGFFVLSVRANEFRVNDDGTVRIDQLSFSSMKEYVESDYFKESGMRCGTRQLQGVEDLQQEKSVTHCSKYLTSVQDEYWPSAAYQIPVWWHVIHRTDGVGNVSNARIEAQMEALNEDYRAKSGSMGGDGFDVKIQFTLAGIDRTANDGWFSDSNGDEYAYKTNLAVNPERYANVYTNDARGYLGYAYFPQDSAGAWWDGIVLNYQTVGGRYNGFLQYDQGRTLVHEMGHYLGLYHTFQGGCTNGYSTGDLIADTNAEAAPNFTACYSASSCGSPDPINNYMDYSSDVCMYEFTREQANRAVCSLVNYRPALFLRLSAVPPVLTPLILSN